MRQAGRFSKALGSKVVSRYRREHAEAIVLLTPQLGTLIPEENSLLPIFDAVVIYARAAARWAMEGGRIGGLPTSNCVLGKP